MRRGAILHKKESLNDVQETENENKETSNLKKETKNEKDKEEIPPPHVARHLISRRATMYDHSTQSHLKSKRDDVYFHAGALDQHRSSFSGAPPQLRRNSLRYNSQRRASRYSVLKNQKQFEVDEEKLTPASEALTTQQKLAFREAFDLFDSNGGGTIDALELKKTLESVGIMLEEEEIHDVMMRLDKDGNGEIDFEEFLNMMTNTEMFLEAFASKHGEQRHNTIHQRDVLLFDALTEFMKKSALSEAHEIVGYYAKTYKKAVKSYNKNKGAHVVSHYADGARLIGLTEKQLVMQLKKLTMCQTFGNQVDKDSPYAQPLHTSMLRSITQQKNVRKKKKVPKQQIEVPKQESVDVKTPHQSMIRQPSLAGSGKIKLKVINNNVFRKEVIHEEVEGIDKRTKLHNKGTEKDEQIKHKPGWLSQRNIMHNVQIPMPTCYRHVQVHKIKELRSKVEEAKNKFSSDVAKKKMERNIQHYKELISRKMPSQPLEQQFQRVFCAYSSAESNNRTAVSVKKLIKITKQNNH